MTIRLFIEGQEYVPFQKEDAPAVEVRSWYDRHYRHWVLYPIDAEGNQLEEARYAFSKAEMKEVKADIEAEYGI